MNIQEFNSKLEFLQTPIEMLEISVHLFKALSRHFGPDESLHKVVSMPVRELLKIKGVGRASIRELEDLLASQKLELIKL